MDFEGQHAALAAKGPNAVVVTSSSAMPRADELRVMTFNLRVSTLFDGPNFWGFRKGLVAETIRSFAPDLLGTQEGLESQVAFLRSELTGYGFFGAGRDDGKQRGEMCGVFYRNDRFERLDGGHFWLSDKPQRPGSRTWGNLFPRMVTWVKLRPRDGGEAFYFFNTHFDAWTSRARERSAALLRERMASIAAGMPVVVTGDFNVGESSKPHQMLVAATGNGRPLIDAYRVVNPSPSRSDGTRHSFTGSRRGDRIDWILSSSHFRVADADIVHSRGLLGYPSDHFPVTAVLQPAALLPVARIE